MVKNHEGPVQSQDQDFDRSTEAARRRILSDPRFRRIAGFTVGASVFAGAMAGCGPDGQPNQTTGPGPTIESLAPTNETEEQRYERYYETATIPAGLSTQELAEAITDRLEKYENISLVDTNIKDLFWNNTETIDSEVWIEKYTLPYIQAFSEAFIDREDSDELDYLVNNTNNVMRTIAMAYIVGDSADIEPYRSYYDVVGQPTETTNDAGQRVLTVDIDGWNNSDKNFVDDNVNKGEDIFRYTITIDESKGRAIMVGMDSVRVN